MMYSIEYNSISDLEFMRKQLKSVNKLLKTVKDNLESCGDYERYVNQVDNLQDLLSAEDNLCVYFIEQKTKEKKVKE